MHEFYHKYVIDTTYIDESIVNRVTESGWDELFMSEYTMFPDTDADRRETFTDAVRGEAAVIILPSGMLTGGSSPRYLVECGDIEREQPDIDSNHARLDGSMANDTTPLFGKHSHRD